MAKILNLDELVKIDRKIVLHGKEHNVVELSVEGYIESTKISQDLKDASSEEARVLATVGMIRLAVPSVELDELKKLTFPQLTAISEFVREDPRKQADDAEAAAEGK